MTEFEEYFNKSTLDNDFNLILIHYLNFEKYIIKLNNNPKQSKKQFAIQRYLNKRNRRNWKKKIMYKVRKNFANNRKRNNKGHFI